MTKASKKSKSSKDRKPKKDGAKDPLMGVNEKPKKGGFMGIITNRSIMEWVLLALAILFLAGAITFLVLWLQKTEEKEKEKLCTTVGCMRTARNILNSMNKTVKPCDDFYEFACGNYKKMVPMGKGDGSHLGRMAEDMPQKFRPVFIEGLTSTSTTFRAISTFYNICLNTKELNSTLLRNVTSEWPMDNATYPGDLEWAAALHTQQGIDFFATVNVYAMKKGQRNKFVITIPDTKIDELTRINDSFIIRANISGSEEFESAVQQFETDQLYELFAKQDWNITDMLAAAIDLANLSDCSKTFDTNSNMTNLIDAVPEFDWLKYFRRLTNSVNKDTTIYLGGTVECWKKMNPILVTHHRNSISMVSDVTERRTIERPSTKSAMRQLMEWKRLLHFRVMASEQALQNRQIEESCFTHVKKLFSAPLSVMFAHKYFSADDKKNATEVIMALRNVTVEMLKNQTWMENNATMQAAEAKANATDMYIAYEDDLFDLKALDKLYEGLKVNPSLGFKEAMTEVLRWRWDQALKALGTASKSGLDRQDMMHVPKAFFNLLGNDISFSASLLLPPTFEPDALNVYNYAYMGMAIGQEFFHGFDLRGSEYDGNGTKNGWWTTETRKKFNKSAECIDDQYSIYRVEGLKQKVNSSTTLADNIADLAAVTAAFEAYSRYVKKNGTELKLPGLQNFTAEQLFYLSLAQFTCTHAAENYWAQPDLHKTRLETRLRGIVSNSANFTTAFNCSVGSAMNPEKKCSIWEAPIPVPTTSAALSFRTIVVLIVAIVWFY